MEVTIPIAGAAVKVVPNAVEGTTLCKEGAPGNMVIVNVEVPPNTGMVTNFHERLSCLKIGFAIGINAKIITNTLIPPYVRMADIINSATNALYGFLVPTTDKTLFAIETVAPLLSMYFARMEPNKKIAKLDAINPARDVIYEFSLPNTVSSIGTSLKSNTTIVAIGAATMILNFLIIKRTIVAIPNKIPKIPNKSILIIPLYSSCYVVRSSVYKLLYDNSFRYSLSELCLPPL